MTLQEWKQMAFNGAWRGIQWQGFAQSTSGASCVFDGPDRTHCALGWLMPSGSGKSEFSDVSDILERFIALPLRFPRYGGEPGGFKVRACFLRGLQSTHDGSHTPTSMEAALRYFASRHRLAIPTPWGG